MGAVANEIDVFAELYFADCVTPLELTFTAKDTYYKLSGLNVGQQFNCSSDGEDITIEYDGIYKIQGVASLYPSAGCAIRFSAFINETAQDNICTALSFQNNQDTNTFSGSGLLRVSAGDKVSVRASCDTAGVDLEMTNFNLVLMRMGL